MPDKLMLGGDYALTLELPFSWKFFYFAAVSFTLAAVLFAWKCPPLIRLFDDWSDYKNKGVTAEQISAFLCIWLRRGGNFYSANGEHLDSFVMVKRIAERNCIGLTDDQKRISTPYNLAQNLVAKGDREANYYWDVRSWMNSDCPAIRKTIFALYALGFILFACVLISNLWYVLKVLWPS